MARSAISVAVISRRWSPSAEVVACQTFSLAFNTHAITIREHEQSRQKTLDRNSE